MPGSRLERIARPVRGGAFTSFVPAPDGFSLTHGRPHACRHGARDPFFFGAVAQRQGASFATRRSRVRIPSAPPRAKRKRSEHIREGVSRRAKHTS